MPAQTSNEKYAPTTWGGEVLEDVEVPSGQLCQCRRPGMQSLIQHNLLDRMDILTNLVQTEHIDRVKKGKTKQTLDDYLSDPDKLIDALNTIDRVVEYVVVQPEVHRPVVADDESGKERPMFDHERLDGVIYTDMIDLEDKMFLFNYAVGGTRDIAQFRSEFTEIMDDMGVESDVAVSSQ